MLGIFLATCLSCSLIANDIVGFWTTISDKTQKPESIVAIYEHEGMEYGRLIGSFDRQTGAIHDTLYHPITRAPGLAGNPFYSGLDFIYHLKKKGSRFKGNIIDPRQGNVYHAELWTEKGNLIVKGKFFIFWRNQTWKPFSNFTADFPKPDVSKFIPIIPQK